MPLTVRLIARDGTIYDTELDGTAQTAVVTWESAAPSRMCTLTWSTNCPTCSA